MRKSPSTLTKIFCDFCGKEREIDHYALTKRKNHFCSKKCFYAFWHKTRSKEYSCATCGKKFERADAFLKNKNHKTYCSHACRFIGKKNQPTWSKGKKIGLNSKISGEKHWNWQGGKTDLYWVIRGSSLMVHWRSDVFSRDDFTCKKCGEKGGKLEAHHLIQFKVLFKEFLTKYDKEKDLYIQLSNFKKLWDLKNGVTLCKKCHSEWHIKNGK